PSRWWRPRQPRGAVGPVRADSGVVGRGLNMVGGPSVGKCAPGWDAAGPVSGDAAPVALLARAASLVRATADGPNDGGRGGSADRSPPENPAPSQGPSGAAVGGAAVGGAGSATSAFLTLMAVLLLAAPHVIRRLRLCCER